MENISKILLQQFNRQLQLRVMNSCWPNFI